MDALLVSTSTPNFDNLMSWTFQALGTSISIKADEKRLKGVEKYASCLEQLGADPLKHIHLSFQFICPEQDVIAVLEQAGLPFVAKATVRRGIIYGFVSGTVSRWRDAVDAGLSNATVSPIYQKIKSQIQGVGLNPWKQPANRIEHKK